MAANRRASHRLAHRCDLGDVALALKDQPSKITKPTYDIAKVRPKSPTATTVSAKVRDFT